MISIQALLFLSSLAFAAGATVHTVFTTECTQYFTWQSLGMMYSHKKSGQPGKITRLMSCTKEEFEALSEADMSIAPTHVAPSFSRHPRTGDMYSAYNKPVAIMDWLAKTEVEEDYILILDADMIMREPFLPDELGAAPGHAVSAFYGYLKGVNNDLALKHVPEVLPRNDTNAGPKGRRGDQVGGFILQHQSDLRRMVPYWIKFSEDVRADPDAWELSGDSYSIHKGDKPWISEMYGYSFGAAKANVWHSCHHTAMLYPGYEVVEPPKVLHYGLLWDVKGTDYKFDKHWHYDFNPLQCPPWEDGKKKALFPHAPSPSSFQTQGTALLRDLLAVEVPITLNEAFCAYLRANCPASEQLTQECNTAQELAAELAERFEALLPNLPDPCSDTDGRCPEWAEAGECTHNLGFMADACRRACKLCHPRGAPNSKSSGVVIHHTLAKEGNTGTQGARKGMVGGVEGRSQDEAPKLGQQGGGGKKGAFRLGQDTERTQEEAEAKGQAWGDALAGQEQLKQQEEEVGVGSGIEEEAAVEGSAADLKWRCKTLTELTAKQMSECLEMAVTGRKYEVPYQNAVGRREEEGGKGQAGGDAGAGTQREEGQQQEEEEEEQHAPGENDEGEGGSQDAPALDDPEGIDAVAEALIEDKAGGRKRFNWHRFEQGRILKEGEVRAEAVVSGTAVMLQKYGVLGLMFWAAAILLFFCILPRAGRWHRGGPLMGRLSSKKLSRND